MVIAVIVAMQKEMASLSALLHNRKDETINVTFITTKSREGKKIYERGATMMLLSAVYEIYGQATEKAKTEYAIGDSIYFKIKINGKEKITEEDIQLIKEKMNEYVKKDYKFEKMRVHTRELIEFLKTVGVHDKERLFHYRLSSYINVYKMNKYYDYFYGSMPYSTKQINVFDIKANADGLLLVLPKLNEPTKQGSSFIPMKMFNTMFESNIWSENINVTNVAELNDAIVNGNGRDIILSCEAYQEHIIGEIASRIKKENRRIVLIAGPSSSGKTSFSHRLAIQLKNLGIKAHPIGMDNFYLDRTLIPTNNKGEKDFECLEAFNIELFNNLMLKIMKGDETILPTFNFRTGKPEFNSKPMKISDNEVLIIEGIHGINDKFSYAIKPEDKYKIYISAITTLNIDEHNRIPTTDHRMIRRMVRDARTRGFSCLETIKQWSSVRSGEEKYIFPFQESADFLFNSASVYELAVLKQYVEPLLFAINRDEEGYLEAKRLLKFLNYFISLPSDDVPKNSIVREFIGGSIFPVG